VIDPFSLFSLLIFFSNFTILVLVALATKLAAAKEALSMEKTAQSTVEATRQMAYKTLQASEEARAALMKDLQSVKASLTATMEKLASKSSALDFVVVWER
jgi:hypothetical protein